MVDLSELNYKQLIALEKQIQEEKARKVKYHVTKSDLCNSDDAKTIFDILDKRFQEEKYGWPQKLDVTKFTWNSEEEKEEAAKENLPAPVAENVYDRVLSSTLYLCDVAFQNYRDAISKKEISVIKAACRISPKSPEDRYYTVSMNKEIPWEKSKDYKEMYEEITKVFLKYAEKKS